MRRDDVQPEEASPISPKLVLVLLFLVSVLNYLDRFVLGILLPAIKAEFRLTDTQLGFVTGVAFAIFYTFAGIPIGHLADRFSRRKIIGLALATWSAMTIAFGCAQTFGQLVVARILLGVGEAGATPPSHSLISDVFPPRARASALAIFSMGMPLGILLGYLGGGYAVGEIGWRGTLALFGLPGLLLAIVLWFALPDPYRGALDKGIQRQPGPVSLGRAVLVLARGRSYLYVCLGSGCYAVVWSGLIIWLPSYFIRNFHLPVKEAGAALALVLGASQLLGLMAGGKLADGLCRRDLRWAFWICALGGALSVPFFAFALLWQQPAAALAALFPAFFFALLQGGPAAAIVQAVAGSSRRAVAAAIYLAVVNLISALGTQVVGFLSDRLGVAHGTTGLGTSMLFMTVLFSLGAVLNFVLGARHFAADAEHAEGMSGDHATAR